MKPYLPACRLWYSVVAYDVLLTCFRAPIFAPACLFLHSYAAPVFFSTFPPRRWRAASLSSAPTSAALLSAATSPPLTYHNTTRRNDFSTTPLRYRHRVARTVVIVDAGDYADDVCMRRRLLYRHAANACCRLILVSEVNSDVVVCPLLYTRCLLLTMMGETLYGYLPLFVLLRGVPNAMF